LVKPLATAIALIVVISLVALYVVPQYVYVSPFSSFYVSGIVVHKLIGHGTNNGEEVTTYTVSVVLFNGDPVNRIQSGEALAYIVSKADWDKVAWGDTVKIKILPSAQAEIVELYPTLSQPEWQRERLSITTELTSDKQRYAVGETAAFQVQVSFPSLPEGDTPYNVTLVIFDNCTFYAFQSGRTVVAKENSFGTQEVTLQPSQQVDYSFSWNLAGVSPGTYYVRAYLGYLEGLDESNTLSATTLIYVLDK
jgi:hypothetical protein